MYAIFKDELVAAAKKTWQQHSDFLNAKIPLNELHQHQSSQLQDVIRYVINGSPFYHQHLKGLTQTDINQLSVQNISQLPFTTKDDLRNNSANLAAAPLSKSWVYYETTGTTGSPTPCPRNEIDSIHNNTPLIHHYRTIFAQHGEDHIVGVMGPTELHSTGDTFEDVFRSLGYSIVKMWPRSPVVGMQRAMTLINDLRITALVCTPAVAIAVARYIKNAGLSPQQTSVRLILTVGELTTPALLRNIGDVWGAKVYSCMYASQEASILAACAGDGELYTVPLNNLYEIIDPASGQPRDIHHGQTMGELVITHLYRGQKPLIRYRTGDMVRSTAMPDGSQKITPVGRVRDVLILNGQAYCAWDLEAALLNKLHGCLDYAIEINNEQGADALNITVEMFDANTANAATLEQVKAHMQASLPGVRIAIQAGETSAITGTSAMVSWKAARLHDLRPAADNRDREAALALLNRGFK